MTSSHSAPPSFTTLRNELRKFTPARRLALSILSFVGVLAASAVRSNAQSDFWDGQNNTSGDWNANNNFQGINFPGELGTTTNPDVSTFQKPSDKGPGANLWGDSATNAIGIPSTLNIGGMIFNADVPNFWVGTTGGNTLSVSSGGSILYTTLNVGAASRTATVNAPLRIENAGGGVTGGGTYSFTNDTTNGATTTSGTLTIGGAISRTTGTATTTLNLNGTNTNTNLVSGNISGDIAVAKSGVGLWSLSGTNTYTGPTSITSGTLLIDASGALSNFSAVTISNGGLRLGNSGITDTAGALTLSGSLQIIDFGTAGAGSQLTFLTTNPGSWTGQLQIWNWSGIADTGGGDDQLKFLSLSPGPSTFAPSQVQFYSGAGTGLIGFGAAIVNANNELVPSLVPIPEARTVAGVMALLALVGWRERRFFLRSPEALARARANSR